MWPPGAAAPPLTPAFRFDRVEEGQLALRARHTGPGGMDLRGEAGFSTGLERWSLKGAAKRGWGWRGGYSFLEADLHRGAGSHYGSAVWPTVVNTVQALLAEDDDFDYYWNAGYALTAGHDLPLGRGRVCLDWRDEDHSVLARTTDRDLVGRDAVLRANPPVDAGRMRRLGLSCVWAPARHAWGRGSDGARRWRSSTPPSGWAATAPSPASTARSTGSSPPCRGPGPGSTCG